MDIKEPTEADGGLTPTQTFGPNIPTAMDVIFGAYEAQGTLPVDIPQVDETGSIITGENAYEYGFGITDLTSVGISTSINEEEVKSLEEFDVKLSLSEIEGLKSDNYSLKVNFNNVDFEVVSVKSNDEKLSVVDYLVDGSLLTINLSDINEDALTDVTITLKAIGEAKTDAVIFDDIKVLDGKDREFTTSGTYSTINIVEDNNTNNPDVPVEPEAPIEPEKPSNQGNSSKPGNTSKPSSGKLPNTGGTSAVAVGIFGTLIATAGAFISRKKK